jgi:hypothetical protein
VIRGDSHMYFTPANVGVDLIVTNKVRGLAVTTPMRLPTLPDVPTFAEQGYPQVVMSIDRGIAAPKGVSPEIVKTLTDAFWTASQTPEFFEDMKKAGVDVNVMKGEHKTPGYFEMHPHGLLPVLEDGDLRIIESAAMVMHLADKANQYVDQQKPWIVAKDPARVDEARAIATQPSEVGDGFVALLGAVGRLWVAGSPADHPLLASLGPEPFDAAFDADHFWRATRARTAAIKLALMDNHLVVVVGKIYASEALFRAGISPRRAAGRVVEHEFPRVQQVARVCGDVVRQEWIEWLRVKSLSAC